MARLLDKYQNEIIGKMMHRFGYRNRMAVPMLRKIVVNMGVGRAIENKRRIETAVKELATITGQKPVVTHAKVSVAGFKLREGDAVGCMVTLRGARMYEFLDRLVSVAVPRIRDFRGLSSKSFDGRGSYSMGVGEQVIFPEINLDEVEFTQGMDISMVTTARSDEEARYLLELFGMPFRKN